MDSAYFSGRSGAENNCILKFFLKFGSTLLCGPVAAKPFVLEDFFLGKGTSVASALTVETGLKL